MIQKAMVDRIYIVATYTNEAASVKVFGTGTTQKILKPLDKPLVDHNVRTESYAPTQIFIEGTPTQDDKEMIEKNYGEAFDWTLFFGMIEVEQLERSKTKKVVTDKIHMKESLSQPDFLDVIIQISAVNHASGLKYFIQSA